MHGICVLRHLVIVATFNDSAHVMHASIHITNANILNNHFSDIVATVVEFQPLVICDLKKENDLKCVCVSTSAARSGKA